MKELIDRGYLYIAQPPLFKVKKGKSERYIKDERSLEEHLLELALASVDVVPSGAQQPIEQDQLRHLLECASYYRKLLERLEQRLLDRWIVDAAVRAGVPREGDLTDGASLETSAGAAIVARLREDDDDGRAVTWSTQPDPEHGSHRLIAETRRAGRVFSTALDTDFLRSPDFQRLEELSGQIAGIAASPFSVRREGEELETCEDAVALLERLLALGEKGVSIQRYKGLGEMNPDQLADTTLDPASRTLLQVRVPDIVEADDAFTRLMGDDVEPRREFIERNALDVQNLDI
jgi:DNA gyrase subunit B